MLDDIEHLILFIHLSHPPSSIIITLLLATEAFSGFNLGGCFGFVYVSICPYVHMSAHFKRGEGMYDMRRDIIHNRYYTHTSATIIILFSYLHFAWVVTDLLFDPLPTHTPCIDHTTQK